MGIDIVEEGFLREKLESDGEATGERFDKPPMRMSFPKRSDIRDQPPLTPGPFERGSERSSVFSWSGNRHGIDVDYKLILAAGSSKSNLLISGPQTTCRFSLAGFSFLSLSRSAYAAHFSLFLA